MPTNPLEQTFDEIDSQDLSNIRMLGDHILLRVYPKKEITEGGIVMTEGAQDKRCVAWVLAVGPGVDPLIQPGDTVMCPFSDFQNHITELDDHRNVVYILANDVVVHYPKKTAVAMSKRLT